jgi:tetratricopeptide (TPR) repeat protein
MIALGDLLADTGDVPGARDAYEQVIASDDRELAIVGAMNLGMMLAEADPQRARQAFDRALAIPPGPDAVPWTRGGPLYDSAAHYGAQWAHAAYRKTITAGHPRFAPMAHALLGCLLAQDGDVQAAREAFHHAEQSEHPEARHIAARGLLALEEAEGQLPLWHAYQHRTLSATNGQDATP